MRNRRRDFTIVRLVVILGALSAACGDGNGDIEASGTLEATLVTVSAKVGGDVLEVRAAEGARVKKGDLLARLDNTTLSLKREQAAKGLELAETEVALVTKGARREDVEQAQSLLVQAENADKVAQEDFRRMKSLFESGSVTKKQRDDAEARAASTKAQKDGAAQGLRKIRNISRPEEVRFALLKRDQARLSVSLCDEELSSTGITAPQAGVVTHQLVEEGELVFPGSALFSIADLSQIHLTIYLSERDLARISVGQQARVRIDAFPDRDFAGEVVYLSPRAEFTPKNVQAKEDRVKLVFAVKIRLPNPDEALKPGLPADAFLQARDRGNSR